MLHPGAQAVARPRGPLDTLMPMTMIRIEPMAMPQRQITGLASELVDTRIVEVLFRVSDTKNLSVYPGQMVDVFIDTPRVEPAEK